MRRLYHSVIWFLLLASGVRHCTTAIAAESRPNVIVIVADDLGAMDLSCYGSKFHRTPHLDKLAACLH